MIKSMTAFGRSELTIDDGTYFVEIRCLNRRYCEISVRLPQQLAPLEDRVKKLISSKILRGRADVTIKQRRAGAVVPHIEVNVPLATAYFNSISRLKEDLGIAGDVGLDRLLNLEGIITTMAPELDLEASWGTLHDCLLQALESIDTMRLAEGEAIYQDFQERLKVVDEYISQIKVLAPSVVLDYQDRLKERISMLTEGKVELDPNRLAQEAAFLADKGDITEEIVRTESHLKQFRSMLESEGAIGRPLDFLLQELNREINTIGSKAGDAQLSHLVVSVKSELEKLREQVQNVE
jgi:uncharacterized protein (TIGR00255 family)